MTANSTNSYKSKDGQVVPEAPVGAKYQTGSLKSRTTSAIKTQGTSPATYAAGSLRSRTQSAIQPKKK